MITGCSPDRSGILFQVFLLEKDRADSRKKLLKKSEILKQNCAIFFVFLHSNYKEYNYVRQTSNSETTF